MALKLATVAETALRGFFRADDALRQLQGLYESTHAGVVALGDSGGRAVDLTQGILDVAVQKVAEELSWRLLREAHATPTSVGVPALLDLCIDGIIHKLLLISAAYKVLEDLMEGQTIGTCELLWELLEQRKARLSSKAFLPESGRPTKASLCLLRLCNSLLRRVSRTQNSVFCGRILVFLSFTFTLSERSAVNLLGKPNTANMTVFEEQEEFDAAETHDSAQVAAIPTPTEELDGDRDGTPIDYNLYRTFWDLQRFCRDHQLATKSAEDWETFFDELNTVLSAFEGNAFSPDDLERSRDLMTSGAPTVAVQGETDDDGHAHFFQPKYLTNSRLFRLQLRDPILRECMLTQFLILFSHLSKAKQPDGCTTPKGKLVELQERVTKLLRETPSDGKGFSEMLTIVLERERNWIKWKLDKCPPYERFPQDPAATADATAAKPKRRLGDAPMLSGRAAPTKRARLDNGGAVPLMEQILSAGSKPTAILERIKAQERATAVSMETYMQRFTEAWDPENGIEEAYWPDKDKMYCWRTLRRAMTTNVEYMDLAVNGTGAVVKGIIGHDEGPSRAGTPRNDGDKAKEPTTDSATQTQEIKRDAKAAVA